MRAVILPNYDDSGNIFYGMIRKRNAIDAGIFLGLMVLILYKGILGSPYIILYSFWLIFAIIGCFVCCIGMQEYAFTEFLFIIARHYLRRTVATLQMPADPDHD